MKRSLAIIGITIMLIICSTFFINKVYAAKEKPINNETESTLVELKEKEMKSLEDYEETYGSKSYSCYIIHNSSNYYS